MTIMDAKRQFDNADAPKTIVVVVAPRILLAEQLCSEFLEHIDNVAVMHVHSGDTKHFSSTKPNIIHNWSARAYSKQLIFTTYHSLHRIKEAGLNVHTIHFDESHNSVQKSFFPATEYFSANANRCYFHTATPVHSAVANKPGMNDGEVYGDVICKVPAPELVSGGFIVPPKVSVRQIDIACSNAFERDCKHLLDTIEGEYITKGLICAKSTNRSLD